MPPDIAARVDAIARAIASYRFTYQTEVQFQNQLAEVFTAAGIPFTREHPLGGGRVDFMAWGCVAVEVKIKGSPAAVLRQLVGYAADPACLALVLVTARRKLGAFPAVLEGKPTKVVALWQSFLGSMGG